MRTPIRVFIGAATAALAVLGPLSVGAQSASPPKFAFINSQQILAVAPGRADAEAAYQKEVDNVRGQEKAMSDSLQAMVSSYQNVESTLSAADRTSRETAIRAKQAGYQQRQQQIEQAAQAKQAELIQPIFDRINKVLSDIRVEDGYTAILDVNPGGGGGAVVAYDKNLDITDHVIAKVKAMPVASGSPSSTGTGVGANPNSTRPKGPTNQPSGVTRPPGN
ncbi:MAG TPA: OmpH family outer membrane protein [Gemmatimonadaceae bacterium]|jgi:outer membrane protein|nr:OmpH family outer membrane protein [Gemmatimonadaceae bacterium]